MADPKYIRRGSAEDKAIEECAELIQSITKGKRFGWDNAHPDRPAISNRHETLAEIRDVQNALLLLERKLTQEKTNG